jgi:hypothetical protein
VFSGTRATAAVLCLWALSCGASAFAYRPFEGTDAAVADLGELEIEFGPAEPLREGPQRFLTAPETVFNLGVVKDWEVVLQGQAVTLLSPGPTQTSLVGNALFLKHVWRDGVLQDKAGPSVATEFGPLLPGVNGEPGTGVSWTGIASYRWDWLTVHFNGAAALTRSRHADGFLGTIVEGPWDWPVRPVAEVFYEREWGAARTVSGLVGAIWQVSDKLAVDIAVRDARVNRHTVNELRAGVTFGLLLW